MAIEQRGQGVALGDPVGAEGGRIETDAAERGLLRPAGDESRLIDPGDFDEGVGAEPDRDQPEKMRVRAVDLAPVADRDLLPDIQGPGVEDGAEGIDRPIRLVRVDPCRGEQYAQGIAPLDLESDGFLIEPPDQLVRRVGRLGMGQQEGALTGTAGAVIGRDGQGTCERHGHHRRGAKNQCRARSGHSSRSPRKMNTSPVERHVVRHKKSLRCDP